MSEEKKTTTLGLKSSLTLKGGEQVRQSFSHGRSKSVQVEHVKVRNFDVPATPSVAPEIPQAPAQIIAKLAEPVKKFENSSPSKPTLSIVPKTNQQTVDALKHLSPAERESRMRALENAAEFNKLKEEERDRLRQMKQQEELRRKSEEEASQRLRREEEDKRRLAEEDRRKREIEAKKKSEEAAKQAGLRDKPKSPPGTIVTPAGGAKPVGKIIAKRDEEEEAKKKVKKNRTRNEREDSYRSNRINLNKIVLSEDSDGLNERTRSLASMKRAKLKEKSKSGQFEAPEKIFREITLPDHIQVGDLANRMSERLNVVIKELMKLGVMANQNMMVDADTAQLVAETLGHTVKRVADEDIEITVGDRIDDADTLLPRSPVVTVMGHVDHGKTSLLDALRKTDVAAGEAGGITQHIGAYSVALKDGRHITFLDTPGHEAFTAMRSRGAQVTDIVVLVVAADDGIQPQTIEAIAHAKAAKVPIVVAINKCDKGDADPKRVREQLLNYELVVEQMGGDVQSIEVSAKKMTNLDKLEEAILLQAEILELKANPNREARGIVVEAKLEKGRGAVATVLIKKGTLKLGDVYVMGAQSGRVRALLNDKGKKIQSAGPSSPVEIVGLQGLPEAGDEMIVVETDGQARQIAEGRAQKKREAELFKVRRSTMDQMFQNIKDGELKNLPIVIKTDVHGSLEALSQAFQKLSTNEVQVQILHGAVGGITETDVSLASSTNGIVIGFNVRANPQARDLAKRDGTEIRYYSIIYEALDDAKLLLSGMLSPDVREVFLGYAQIREVFTITNYGKIAGCMVTEGMVKRGAKIRLLRDNVVIYDGSLKQLKRFKDDVKEVNFGYECGMSLENWEDIRKDDQIECYELKSTARTLG